MNWFTITHVHERIYALAEFSHWEKVVSYLILGETEAVLVDAGMGYESMRDAVRSITALPVRVVLTHAHWDHIGGASLFSSVGIFDDPYEKALLARGFQSSEEQELTDTSCFTAPWKPKEYTVFGVLKPQVLHDQQALALDGYTLRVIHTPGHTPGSVCFYIPEWDVLLTGDTIYPGPLYAYLPECDPKLYAASCKKLARLVTTTTMLLPGHNDTHAASSLLYDVVRGWETIAMNASQPKQEEAYDQYTFDTFSLLLPKSRKSK
jgi:glyoxylase-like metal-dependent hydrolase (beta-lactamase superfamily II)